MKTLKEPRPFCPPFLLPLSPLSRRRHVAFCAFNQQLFLSSRDLSVFCPDSLSLFLAKQPKREPETNFFGSKSTKSASFLPSTKKVKDLSCFFIFCEHRPTLTDSWHLHLDKKDTQKPRYLNWN